MHVYRCGWVRIALSVRVAQPTPQVSACSGHVVQQKSRPRVRAAVSQHTQHTCRTPSLASHAVSTAVFNWHNTGIVDSS